MAMVNHSFPAQVGLRLIDATRCVHARLCPCAHAGHSRKRNCEVCSALCLGLPNGKRHVADRQLVSDLIYQWRGIYVRIFFDLFFRFWLLGFVAVWLLACLASWLLGFLASWLLGFSASWLLGFSASWLLGCWASGLLGFLASWLLGFLASWLFGFLASWLLGLSAAGLLSFLASWLFASISRGKKTIKKHRKTIPKINPHPLTVVRVPKLSANSFRASFEALLRKELGGSLPLGFYLPFYSRVSLWEGDLTARGMQSTSLVRNVLAQWSFFAKRTSSESSLCEPHCDKTERFARVTTCYKTPRPARDRIPSPVVCSLRGLSNMPKADLPLSAEEQAR